MRTRGLALVFALLSVQTSAAATGTPIQKADDPSTVFGHKILREEFLLNYTNLNHGSYGACPKRVLNYQSALRLQQEQQPDPWMRSRYLQMQNDTRKRVSQYVNADDPDNLVLVESASTAVNSLLRTMEWQSGDIVLYFSVAYGMVKNTALWLSKRSGVEILEVPVLFPILDSRAFIAPLEETLRQLGDDAKSDQLKVAVLDHIASIPAVTLPVLELATMIKAFSPNTFVMVDGAHAMGQLQQLDLRQLGPIDAYLSNGHKWLYSPKGSAFLWVNASQVSAVFPEPTVISSQNNIGTMSLVRRYSYTSTRDYTALLSMSAALDFRQQLGGDEAIYTYVKNLALLARRYLMKLWDACPFVPESMEEFMINIALPTKNATLAKEIQHLLLQNHAIYIVVAQEPTSGIIFTRLSSQIYLEMSDFTRLGELVLQYTQNSCCAAVEEQ